MTSLKKKLQNKELTIGSWLSCGYNPICEIMCQSGFEWLVIDIEHTTIDFESTQNLIQIIELSGITPLVRVGCNNEYIIKRVMDAGAYGVIVPMINSKEDAIKAVNAVKYPPNGTRGVGLARAQKYGVGFQEYKEWVENESIVIAQIEHIRGVENIDEILSVKGIDGFIIGPYDLSASLGEPGNFDHPDVKDALGKIRYFLKCSNKPGGFHVVHSDIALLKK